MGILDINTKKHSGASSRPFWEGYYPLETKGAGAPWLRAYQHSWITYLEASSHSSSLSLYRNHTKLSYISQRFPLKHIDYLSCYTVVKSGELYKWRRSLHLFFTSFLYPNAHWLSKHLYQQAIQFILWSQNHFHIFILLKLSCPFSSLSKNSS